MQTRPSDQAGHAPVRAVATALPAPTVIAQLDGNGKVIDDNIIAAQQPDGIPFQIPAYADMAEGDFVELMVNGQTARLLGPLTPAEVGIPLAAAAVLGRFQFTGSCSVTYVVTDVHSLNKSASAPLDLWVVRSAYPGPDTGPFDYPAPALTPARYAEAAFNRHTPLSVKVSYPHMRPGDMVHLHFDLYATTSDRPQDYFYSLAKPVPPQAGSATGSITFTLAAAQFAGIDENIGHVFYSVYTAALPAVEMQSSRADFQLDVVPPHN